GAGVADDFAYALLFVGCAVDKFVGHADFEQAAVHDEAADGTPTLRTGMGPEQDGLAAGDKVANRANQVRSPDPCAGKEHDEIDVVVGFHFFQGGASFLLGGEDCAVFHDCQSSLGERSLCLLDNGIVDERGAHGVFQTVFVNSVNDESDCWLNHGVSFTGPRASPAASKNVTTDIA